MCTVSVTSVAGSVHCPVKVCHCLSEGHRGHIQCAFPLPILSEGGECALSQKLRAGRLHAPVSVRAGSVHCHQ